MLKRFLERRLSFPDCIAALDAALAGLIPTLTGEQIPRLRIVMLANNEIVMKEMETARDTQHFELAHDPQSPPLKCRDGVGEIRKAQLFLEIEAANYGSRLRQTGSEAR